MSVLLVVGAVLAGVPVVSAAGRGAADNESPLADAGLDRNVAANSTVYLDATGSRDPDGEIEAYRWRIELPDGGHTTPSCAECGRTRFVAHRSGTYNATVTVTDDDGATATDTLQVHVDPSSGPSVILSGPDSVVEGGVREFSASVTAGANDLAAVIWRFDGHRTNRTAVGGESATVDRFHAFRVNGTVTVSVTGVDRLGRERTATKNVTVTEPSVSETDGGGGSAGDGADRSGRRSGSTGSDDGLACSRFGRDSDLYCNNDRLTVDSNGVVISDVDNDGSIVWAGVTIDAEFARNHDGVSSNSVNDMVTFDSQAAYKRVLGVNTVNVDPEADINNNGLDSSRKEVDQNSFLVFG
ncbi:MAG: PKD domain-containing protein [Halosimplex sp.]